MGFFACILAACFLALALGDDTCPQAKDISPCTCDGEGMNCMGAINMTHIKKAFRANFKYGGVRAVWIQATQLQDVPADLFGTVKSQRFYIEVNSVTSVNLDAFKSSQNILTILSFFGNKLQSFPYSNLRNYPNLKVLNLGRNQLQSIPNSAFSNLALTTLIVAENQISTIGQNAFAGMNYIQRLDLNNNKLRTLGPLSLASRAHDPNLQVNLQYNQISEVSNTAFDGLTPRVLLLGANQLTSLPSNSFFNLVNRMGNNFQSHNPGGIEVTGNPFTCKGCDYRWIVNNKQATQQLLVGFRCTDGKTIAELTTSNIGC